MLGVNCIGHLHLLRTFFESKYIFWNNFDLEVKTNIDYFVI